MEINNQNLIQENRDFLIKQSEILQAIITRMASNSLTIKQLGLTIWTTLVGFGFTNKTPSLFVLAIISFGLLGLLDMYYLYLEKRFRRNFKLLTEILCGFDKNSLETMQRLKGNFVTLETVSGQQILSLYLEALKSWANLPYLIVSIITLILLQTSRGF